MYIILNVLYFCNILWYFY